MKEELIKELVASSKLTNRINIQYQQKMDLLAKENAQLKSEIEEVHKNMSANGSAAAASNPLGNTSREPSRVET